MEFLSAFQFLIPSVIAITFGTMIINIFPSTEILQQNKNT